MSIDEAKASIGKRVMTTDPGYKLIQRMPAHGPYVLKQVTKAGLVILEGYDDHRPSPSSLTLAL